MKNTFPYLYSLLVLFLNSYFPHLEGGMKQNGQPFNMKGIWGAFKWDIDEIRSSCHELRPQVVEKAKITQQTDFHFNPKC